MSKVLLWVLIVVLCMMVQAQKFECEPNALYLENRCNRCSCSTNGYLLCGMKRCPVKPRLSLYNCKPGARYIHGCNECWCVEGFGTVCSHRKCS